MLRQAKREHHMAEDMTLLLNESKQVQQQRKRFAIGVLLRQVSCLRRELTSLWRCSHRWWCSPGGAITFRHTLSCEPMV